MKIDPSITKALSVLKTARVAADLPPLEVIPTDIAEINDSILGCGGLPRGRIMEIYSKPSVGKSTLAYWFAGQVQKRGGIAALFDAEGAYMPGYGAACGIDNETLVIPDFSYGEDALYQIKLLLATNVVDLIILDSMPMLQPFIAAESTKKAATMNIKLARAAMYTMFFQDITGGYTISDPDNKKENIKSNVVHQVGREKVKDVHRIFDKKTHMICINHAKNAIGVMWGDRIKTPCGDAINFAAGLRLGATSTGKSTKKAEGGGPLFKEIKVKAVKNKLAPPLNEIILRLPREGGVLLADGNETDVEEAYDQPDLPDDVDEGTLGSLKSTLDKARGIRG